MQVNQSNLKSLIMGRCAELTRHLCFSFSRSRARCSLSLGLCTKPQLTFVNRKKKPTRRKTKELVTEIFTSIRYFAAEPVVRCSLTMKTESLEFWASIIFVGDVDWWRRKKKCVILSINGCVSGGVREIVKHFSIIINNVQRRILIHKNQLLALILDWHRFRWSLFFKVVPFGVLDRNKTLFRLTLTHIFVSVNKNSFDATFTITVGASSILKCSRYAQMLMHFLKCISIWGMR